MKARRNFRAERERMQSREFADFLMDHYGPLLKDHLQGRNNLAQDELEYTVEKVAAMKDARLAQNIATLIGWGDAERAEIETFCAIALEVMSRARPSVLRDAAMIVEMRALGQGADRVEQGS